MLEEEPTVAPLSLGLSFMSSPECLVEEQGTLKHRAKRQTTKEPVSDESVEMMQSAVCPEPGQCHF